MAPVISVDRKIIGDGNAGPISKTLSEGYSALVLGKMTFGHDDWVTRVY